MRHRLLRTTIASGPENITQSHTTGTNIPIPETTSKEFMA